VNTVANALITSIPDVIVAHVPVRIGNIIRKLAHNAVTTQVVSIIFFVSSGLASAHFNISCATDKIFIFKSFIIGITDVATSFETSSRALLSCI